VLVRRGVQRSGVSCLLSCWLASVLMWLRCMSHGKSRRDVLILRSRCLSLYSCPLVCGGVLLICGVGCAYTSGMPYWLQPTSSRSEHENFWNSARFGCSASGFCFIV
jgi:hypothetical protein